MIEVGAGAGAFDGAERGAGAVEKIEVGFFLVGLDVGEEEPDTAAAEEGVEFGGAFVEEFRGAPDVPGGGGGDGLQTGLEAGVGDVFEKGLGGAGGDELEGGGVDAVAGAVVAEGGFGPVVGIEGVGGEEVGLKVGDDGFHVLDGFGKSAVVQALVEGVAEEPEEEEGFGPVDAGGGGGGLEGEAVGTGGDGKIEAGQEEEESAGSEAVEGVEGVQVKAGSEKAQGEGEQEEEEGLDAAGEEKLEGAGNKEDHAGDGTDAKTGGGGEGADERVAEPVEDVGGAGGHEGVFGGEKEQDPLFPGEGIGGVEAAELESKEGEDVEAPET